jgi:hypothetical protein
MAQQNIRRLGGMGCLHEGRDFDVNFWFRGSCCGAISFHVAVLS